MPRLRAAALTLLSLALLTTGLPAHAAPEEPTAPYIVKLRPGPDTEAQTVSARSLGKRMVYEYRAAFPGFAAQLTAAEVAAWQAKPEVEWVLPDTKVTADGVQSGATWGIDRVDQRTGTDGSYAYGPTGAGVTAYVIDSGIARQHSEFTGRVDTGFTSISDGNGTTDCYGHGTHVSGTLAGTRYGIAKGATITPVRVLNCAGEGSDSEVIAGIEWVIRNHEAGAPAVANISLGTGSAVNDAVRALVADGVTTVIAAGNRSVDACTRYPASTREAITVAAIDSTDTEASFSNYGPCVDLYAPGVGITSADWRTTDGTLVYKGTSMATPHVAGAAALVLQARGAITPAEVAAELVGKATVGAVKGARSANRLLFTGGGSTKAPLPAGTPTVSGVAKVGQALTAQPTRTPADATHAYQWARNGSPIAGATAATYAPVPADLGATLTVTVTSSHPDFLTAAPQTSAPVGPIEQPPAPGTFQALAPTRILDTRSALGLPGAIGPQQDGLLQVTGRGGVPAGATAVALNVTVLNTANPGWLAVYPTDSTLPGVSSVSAVPGRAVPNLVIARLAADGQLAIRNGNISNADVVADVAGYWTGGDTTEAGTLVPLTPRRVLDTRTAAVIPAYGTVTLDLAASGAVPADAGAAVLNVTTTEGAAPGYVTVYPAGQGRPATSTVNFGVGDVVSNLTVATLGSGGKVTISNGAPGPVHVVVDLAGYLRGGTATLPGTYVPLSPVRVLDTRPGSVGAGASATVPLPTGVTAQAAFANLTVTDARQAGFATAYPGGTAPLASTVNFVAGQTVANATLVKTSGSAFAVRNGSSGTAAVVVDVSGYFR